MKQLLTHSTYLILGFFIISILFICVVTVPSQTRTPIAIVDDVLNYYKAPYPTGDSYYDSYRQKLKQDLNDSGTEGYNYLIEKAKQSPSFELYRLIPLLSYFNTSKIDGNEMISLIQERGKKAQEKVDIFLAAPLYGNLGFYKPSVKITQYLFDVVAQDDKVLSEWPLFENLSVTKSERELLELHNLIRTFAVLALFHLNTKESIIFLHEMQTNEELSPVLKETISYYFEKIDKFGSIKDFYEDMRKKMPIIE